MATNDDAAAVNEVVREQLVTAGAVDDTHVTHGSDGLRIGVGDQVMTRQNQPDLGVANRMTWTVTGITDTQRGAAVQRGPPATRHRGPRLRAAPPAPRLRRHRARRARRHRRPRRPRPVRRHRRRRRLRRPHPRPTLQHRAHHRRHPRPGPRAMGRRGRPEPRRPRPGPGPRRRGRGGPRTTHPPPNGTRSPSARRRAATGGSASPNGWNGSTPDSHGPPHRQPATESSGRGGRG